MRSLVFRATPIALICVVVAGTARAQQPAFKLAYVNTAVLLENAPGRTAAESTFQKESQGFQAQAKQMSDSLQALSATYQKTEATLTPAQKDARTKAFQTVSAEFQAKYTQMQQQLQARQNELMAPLMEMVRKVLEDIRAEDGYAMILANEPGQSVIVSADKNLDITDRVVARLRTMAAVKAPAKPAVAPAPAGAVRPKPPSE